jgi:hypothetical protein
MGLKGTLIFIGASKYSGDCYRAVFMKEVVKLSGFILLIVGTLGLVINEFVFDWGRAATITFAAFNSVGLATLAIIYRGMRKT